MKGTLDREQFRKKLIDRVLALGPAKMTLVARYKNVLPGNKICSKLNNDEG